MNQRVEVDFEYCFVGFLLQRLGNSFETENTGSFQQYAFVCKCADGIGVEKFFGRVKKLFLNLKKRCLSADAFANAYQPVDLFLVQQFIHLAVQVVFAAAALQNI